VLVYAIRTLQAHGLTGHTLHTVFMATVQAKLLYCSQPGQVTALLPSADRDRRHGVHSTGNGAASDWVTVTLISSQ